ncbi:Putative signal transducing protein [Nonlabens sp. Hel1_33_55]|uniref:putative signal transducing protein n=1 Tax=Nonlabens sp. Hel1_33_55 TaxID=1336802 RepID=UPI000875E2B9|nr:DUF2007 domain-containing protein [Nonlabens sp. Hel1_33_55]SCY17381.1 Putative signal transducing protein [Nonlabens sp. Hel1_33_55]
MKNHIKILTSDSITINRVASVLESENIKVLIKDQTESGRLAGFGVPDNSVELYIQETDLKKAQEFVAELG